MDSQTGEVTCTQPTITFTSTPIICNLLYKSAGSLQVMDGLAVPLYAELILTCHVELTTTCVMDAPEVTT